MWSGVGRMESMKAVQLVEHGTPGMFEIREIPDPQPGPGDVVVQVKACGLNHLDLWVEEAGLPIPIELPRTCGGEVAGLILELGSDVDAWRRGDRVAIQSNLFCGQCEFCLRGEESICLNGRLLGVHCDGGFAQQVVVPATALVALPERVDFHTSAALSLAGSTAIHMLTNRVAVKEGQWVLVMGGASGVGSAAIQVAAKQGARVISTGSTEPKRELAKELGAEYVLDSTQEDWPAEVRRLTGKRGVDVVVEHFGGKTFEAQFRCLGRGGTIVTCGATTGRKVHLDLWPFFVKQQRIIGSYGRNREDVVRTLQWAEEGKLRAVIDQVMGLDHMAEGFRLLRERMVLGKIVIEP